MLPDAGGPATRQHSGNGRGEQQATSKRSGRDRSTTVRIQRAPQLCSGECLRLFRSLQCCGRSGARVRLGLAALAAAAAVPSFSPVFLYAAVASVATAATTHAVVMDRVHLAWMARFAAASKFTPTRQQSRRSRGEIRNRTMHRARRSGAGARAERASARRGQRHALTTNRRHREEGEEKRERAME